MVLTDSHGISRAPCYLGTITRAAQHITATGLTPSPAGLSKPFAYARTHTPPVRQNQHATAPQPRPRNARRLSHMGRFSLIRVPSPLLTESLLFSLPAGTEMFHFPAFPPRTLYIQVRVTQSPHSVVRGFPIRTSWDHRSVINSPRLIADSYVLHRLLMPRHPPCALKNLTTQIKKLNSREPRPTKGQGPSKKLLSTHTRPKTGACLKMLASTM